MFYDFWFLEYCTSLIGKTGKFLRLISNLRVAVLVWLRWGATQWLLSRVLWTKEGSGGNQCGSPRLPNGKVVWRLLAKPIDHLFQSGPTVSFTVDSWKFGLVWQSVYLQSTFYIESSQILETWITRFLTLKLFKEL